MGLSLTRQLEGSGGTLPWDRPTSCSGCLPITHEPAQTSASVFMFSRTVDSSAGALARSSLQQQRQASAQRRRRNGGLAQLGCSRGQPRRPASRCAAGRPALILHVLAHPLTRAERAGRRWGRRAGRRRWGQQRRSCIRRGRWGRWGGRTGEWVGEWGSPAAPFSRRAADTATDPG